MIIVENYEHVVKVVTASSPQHLQNQIQKWLEGLGAGVTIAAMAQTCSQVANVVTVTIIARKPA